MAVAVRICGVDLAMVGTHAYDFPSGWTLRYSAELRTWVIRDATGTHAGNRPFLRDAVLAVKTKET